MSTNINDVLTRTINIYNKIREFKDKYKDEWQVILTELEELVPPKDFHWMITTEKLPKVGDLIITLGPDANATADTFEYNVVVFDGDQSKLHKYWFNLPNIKA